MTMGRSGQLVMAVSISDSAAAIVSASHVGRSPTPLKLHRRRRRVKSTKCCTDGATASGTSVSPEYVSTHNCIGTSASTVQRSGTIFAASQNVSAPSNLAPSDPVSTPSADSGSKAPAMSSAMVTRRGSSSSNAHPLPTTPRASTRSAIRAIARSATDELHQRARDDQRQQGVGEHELGVRPGL